MAPKHQDLWFWTGLAIFGLYSSRAVFKQLLAVQAASQVTEKKDQSSRHLGRHTESELKLESLGLLTQSPNLDIREASIHIVTDLVLRGQTYDYMLRDIAGPDAERRDKALTCLGFLAQHPAKLPQSLSNTYKALVHCLCRLQPEAWASETSLRLTNRANRSGHLRDALTVLGVLLQYDIREATNAGVMHPWLFFYPFGGFTAAEDKNKSIQQLMAWEYDDYIMYIIIKAFLGYERTRACLEKYKYIDKHAYPEIVFVDYQDDSPRHTTHRVREESMEEQALRRRRRETMVLGESGRPIERADIFEPPHDNHNQEAEMTVRGMVQRANGTMPEVESGALPRLLTWVSGFFPRL